VFFRVFRLRYKCIAIDWVPKVVKTVCWNSFTYVLKIDAPDRGGFNNLPSLCQIQFVAPIIKKITSKKCPFLESHQWYLHTLMMTLTHILYNNKINIQYILLTPKICRPMLPHISQCLKSAPGCRQYNKYTNIFQFPSHSRRRNLRHDNI